MKYAVTSIGLLLLVISCSGPELAQFDLQTPNGEKVQLQPAQQPLTVFCFLAPECPLSQNYVKPINELHEQYPEKVRVYNVFSGTVYSTKEVNTFIEDYALKSISIYDTAYALSQYFGATITPEVFMVNSDEEVVYSGKIDNWIESLGVKRQVVTEFYLKDAIGQYLNNEEIAVSKTKAVGCILE